MQALPLVQAGRQRAEDKARGMQPGRQCPFTLPVGSEGQGSTSQHRHAGSRSQQASRKLLQASSGMGKSEQRADFLLPPRAPARRCRLLRSSICAACRQRGLKRSGGPGAGQALLGAVVFLDTQVE